MSGSDDDDDSNPLATPANAWRPAAGTVVQWVTPKGTRCRKEQKAVAYRRRSDADGADCSEEREAVFVLGEAVFVHHVDVDRNSGVEHCHFQLLDLRCHNVFFAVRETAASVREACVAPVFTHGTATAAGVVLRVFATMEDASVDDLLAQVPGEYGWKDILRDAANASVAALPDLRGAMALAASRGGAAPAAAAPARGSDGAAAAPGGDGAGGCVVS